MSQSSTQGDNIEILNFTWISRCHWCQLADIMHAEENIRFSKNAQVCRQSVIPVEVAVSASIAVTQGGSLARAYATFKVILHRQLAIKESRSAVVTHTTSYRTGPLPEDQRHR